jgi:CBS domain-containing protein
MRGLKAFHVMTRPVIAARRAASARDVALQLLTGLYSGMPVTDEDGKVVGVITELDLLKAVQEGKELVKTTAGEIMSTDVVTADVDTPIEDVTKLMTDRNIIRLPITDKGRLVGVVAKCDENAARAAYRGLWSDAHPETPWHFRQRQRGEYETNRGPSAQTTR